MKKFLSIILAISMVLALVPVTFAEGVEQELEMIEISGANTYSITANTKREITDGIFFWEAIQIRRYASKVANNNNNEHAQFTAIQVKTADAGKYNIYFKTNNPTEISAAPEIFIGKYVSADMEDKTTKAPFIGEETTEGLGHFNFSTAEKNVYAPLEKNGKKVEIELEAKTVYYIMFAPDETSFELNPKAKFEGNTVAVESLDGLSSSYLQELTVSGIKLVPVSETVTPEEKPIADTIVNFQASAYGGGSVSNANVQEVTIGSDVTVTAIPDTGYTFAYWKNSAGVVLSTSATETFKVSTNMGVIAVFDEIPTDDAIPVYFYNGNGILLKETTVAKEKTFAYAKTAAGVPATPTLTGYVFSHWSDKDANVAIEDTALITALTRAVAIYKDDEAKTYTVSVTGKEPITGKKYGEGVTVNGSDSFVCWKLGDKVISYEKDYTFDVYGNVTLTEVTEGESEKAPVLVLDKVDGNYFLTYDEGDYELIEAGILFGSDGVSIESIDGYKAAAKKGTGQFTAQPHVGATSSTVARGYMICKDGETLKVIYAE